MILLLLACTEAVDTGERVEVVEGVDPTPLEAPRLARRMSLDLRGVLPSVEELDAVEADPSVLTDFSAAWMADPRFEERVVDLLAERWHTRLDEFLIAVREYPEVVGGPHDEFAMERSIADEPLRMMARVVAEDRPWSDIVTGDTTMANEMLAAVWPLERLSDAPGWQPAVYTDGRPAAGVLASTGLWWRYPSTVSNNNRHRAATVANQLLCVDYLDRRITVADVTVDDSVEEALRDDPYCMGCHSSLDPLAAHFFGFWVGNEHNRHEVDNYHPERELEAERLLGVSPAYFGTPTAGLQELGPLIAADPRFSACTAQTWAELLWRRPATPDDDAVLDALRITLEDNELRLGPMLGALLETDAYRHDEPRMLAPELVRDTIEELTGWRWVWGNYDQLSNDFLGYRVLAGGEDGHYVTTPLRVPSVSQVVVQANVAEGAAAFAVANGTLDLSGPVDETLETLHWRLYGERPSTEQVGAAVALYEALPDDEAWVGVLSGLLRDPAFWTR